MNLSPWPRHYVPPRMAHRYDFLERAALVLGVSIDEIRERSRSRVITRRRFAIAYVMKGQLKYSYPQIGSSLRLDHSSVIHAVRRSNDLIKECTHFAAMVNALELVA